MSAPEDFSFSERNKRAAKTTVNVPPPEPETSGPQAEYKAPPRDIPPPPPRDFPPPPPPRDYLPPQPEPAPRRKSNDGEEDDFELPVDPWRFVMALKRRWIWLIYSAAAFLVIGAIAGFFVSAYKIRITLIQRDVTAPFEAGVGGEVFKPHALQADTIINLMRSPQLLQRVSEKSRPFISARALKSDVSVQSERNNELVHLVISGKSKDSLINLANLYAKEAVQLTKEVQLDDLDHTLKSYQDKEHTAGEDMQKVDKEMQAFREQYKSFDPEAETSAYDKQIHDLMEQVYSKSTQIELLDMRLTNTLAALAIQSPLAKKLEDAKEKLRELKIKYTDAHPDVLNKKDEIAELERQIASASTNAVYSGVTAQDLELRTQRATLEKEVAELKRLVEELRTKAIAVSDVGGRYSYIKAKQDALRNKMKMLAARRSETEYYRDNADGYYRVFSDASWKDIDGQSRWMKLMMVAFAGMVFGIFAAAAVIVIKEAADTRLKTSADVKRVTELPLLASLGDLNKMTPAEKETWAFRAWTALSGQLSRSANHGMVCGIISSTAGEGRTTWVNLLVDAASQRGLRVLTISTRPSPTDLEEMDKAAAEAEKEKEFTEAVAEAMADAGNEMPSTAVTITARALAFPAQVVQKFTGPEALPSAHIALPGWVWNLERRRQFQRALAHWRSIENMVLLVELPPASVPEAVLLAENLPQLIWLVDSGKPRARETREQLETLRHAKCRLVGAVLNHEPESVWKL